MRMEVMNDIPCVILAGGRGTRLLEETDSIPKPMLMVGDKPLLQHVIDIYLSQGVREFIIPVGYRKEQVFGYFFGQSNSASSLNGDGWQFNMGSYGVKVVDTGLDTQTGGRLLRLRSLLKGHTQFFFTYGDGVANVKLKELVSLHTGDTLVTLTAVHPAGRFGRLRFDQYYGNRVEDAHRVWAFGEKIESEQDWVNGGFAILDTRILLGITGDKTNLEKDVYPLVAQHGFMLAHKHKGFWRCVDTLRDLEELRNIHKQESALPWLQL